MRSGVVHTIKSECKANIDTPGRRKGSTWKRERGFEVKHYIVRFTLWLNWGFIDILLKKNKLLYWSSLPDVMEKKKKVKFFIVFLDLEEV